MLYDAKKIENRNQTAIRIKSQLIEQLTIVSIHEIRINSLIEQAQVSRNSFYNHFSNLNDCLSAIDHDVLSNLDTIIRKIDRIPSLDDTSLFVRPLVKWFSTNQDISNYVLTSSESMRLIQLIKQKIGSFFWQDYVRYNAAFESRKLVIYLSVAGTIDAVWEWKRDGQKSSDDQLINAISTFLSAGSHAFAAEDHRRKNNKIYY